jgi:aminoglycoside 6'-N-acetyltransferase I
LIRITSDPIEILKHREQIAGLLLDFRPSCNAWANKAEAIEEVETSLLKDKIRISILALEDDETAGWIAGFELYGKVVEIHPLVVKFTKQKSGIGRLLLAAFEKQAKELGFLSVFLGSDDTDCSTSLGGGELYPHALDKVKTIKNLKSHPYEFYLKCGYEITGILPDANGKGKPDIFMAKTI